MKKIFAAIVAVLAILGTAVSPAQAQTVIDVAVKIASFEGVPISGLRVEVSDTPQAAQTTDIDGATKWKFATGSTYSFFIQVKTGDSLFSPSNTLNVRINVADAKSNEFVIKLPKLIRATLRLTDTEGFDANLLPISYGSVFNDVTLQVNGRPVESKSEFGAPFPSILEVKDTSTGKIADLHYFEPSKLRGPDKSDIDGDLIPDSVIGLPNPYGAITFPLPSSTILSKPPVVSVAQVTWVRALEDNEGFNLTLMQGGKDVTTQFPNGTFTVHVPNARIDPARHSFFTGASIKGSRALYSLGTEENRSYVFGYSLNRVSLGISSLKQVVVRSVACMDNSKGFGRAFPTLGNCPEGWTSTLKLRSLSEKRYANCSSLNKIMTGGVGRSNAFNLGKRAFKGWLTYDKGYVKNKHLDSDKDGIACER